MNTSVKLSCRNLWKTYGPHDALEATRSGAGSGNTIAVMERVRQLHGLAACANVSFDVMRGEIFILMGLSGSGKSTALRCLSRLVEPTMGEILIDGEDFTAKSPRELIEFRRHKMGMVFQNFGLMPHLTVLENIAFPLRVQGIELTERNERARDMMRLVELDGRENSYPRQLSGGQQQRVGIARSLAGNPDIWFLDEPFSALDPLIRRQMQNQFLHLQSSLHKTIIFVTHDISEAVRLADRIAIMKGGEIVQIGAPREILENPANEYVEEFTRDAREGLMIRGAAGADLK
ncbi:quaternary amine ABC transporter ATP-binding protein [Hoeflea alexandrii]|uniref:quaternary amine ABC transporter ATP-binding protein n=1 Tax=Hoeflea alexandrii TaxID=288436 RepID=UPI0022B040FC|nr:betaine/proline/choline family ABC transporter ATP-binding protein [Hoeflea alexandrii]MCZ4291645.1 betaine/proline/choline family ABC transporter ATP-binding protein [Hoeflea alexandrii]